MKHTPGPWMIEATHPNDGWDGWDIQTQQVIDATFSWTPPTADRRYAPRTPTQPFKPSYQGPTETIARCTGPQSSGKRQANARLIAAAPDMLEALANLENDDGKAMPPSAWKLVQDALAKARGET